jgi:hypothetical protein
LLILDFGLGDATNLLWLQVRRKLLTPEVAGAGLALLRTRVRPTSTVDMDLHEVALEIGVAVNHSMYETLHLVLAIATGAKGVLMSDGPVVRDMQTHPDPALAAMLAPLDTWARSKGLLQISTEWACQLLVDPCRRLHSSLCFFARG